MESAVYEFCCDICGVEAYAADIPNYQNEVIKLLKKIDSDPKCRFNVMHRFFGDDDAKDTIEIHNLSLLSAAEKVHELNENVSSYEFYHLQEIAGIDSNEVITGGGN